MIRVENLGVVQSAFSLSDVSFEIPEGQYAMLMGRTGCGKTTLLEALCGLRPVSSGRILLMGRDVTDAKPGERQIGYVPQDRALFEDMTVRGNLAFGPSIRKWGRRLIENRVEELADWLEIGPLLERKPQGLSGGEAQRVALGRALAVKPAILCLDEPLNALDGETHTAMCTLLRSVHKTTGVTVVHVTHNLQEADMVGERVLEMRAGRLYESGDEAKSKENHGNENPSR